MWTTDEYAIKDFRYFCRMQYILVAVAPSNLILIIQLLNLFIIIKHVGVNWMIPYSSNFNKTAARIIGLSTIALGSQRGFVYIGIVAKNVVIKKITIEYFNIIILDTVNDIQNTILINKDRGDYCVNN